MAAEHTVGAMDAPMMGAMGSAASNDSPPAIAPLRVGKLWVAGRLVVDGAEHEAILERVRKRSEQAGAHARVTTAAPHDDTVDDAQQLESLANEHFRSLRIREAIDLFERALAIEPARAGALAGLGACYMHLRDHELAVHHFEKALDSQPDFGRALYGASMCLLALRRFDEAASYARRQASLRDPENRARGLYVLGLVDRAQGDWEEAVQHLEESLRTYPHRRRGQRPGSFEIRHRYELALCYRELNQLDRALVHLKWAVSHGQSRQAVLDLANLYLELGRHEDAEQTFHLLLKQDAGDKRAHVGLGRVHLEKKDYPAAIQSFSTVLSRSRNDLDALSGMADAYKGLGDLDRAAGYLEQIEQLYKVPQAQLERRLRALETERQRRDAELLRMRNIASLNIMATGIAHELRQPLSIIRMAAQNARLDLQKGDTSMLDSDLADIDAGVARLDKIIAVLRDAGSDELRTDEIVDVAEAVDGALLLFRAQFANRNIEIDISHVGRLRALGSRVALQQVLINLISNARDALGDAKEKKIVLSAAESRHHVHIEVRDTGCGMSEAVRDRALDPFFTTKGNGGTGLGLYICYNLIRRMHGSLRIKETSVGRGTTFEVELRRAMPDERSLAEEDSHG